MVLNAYTGKHKGIEDEKHLFKKQNTTSIIIFNGEKLDVFPLKLGTGQGCPFFPIVFNIIPEALARVVRQEIKAKNLYKLERNKYNCFCAQMT